MLSVSKISDRNHGEYYIELATEDYYVGGGEPPGFWIGTGAEALGLSGLVEKDSFRRVLQGFSPDGSRALVQNAGRIDPVEYKDKHGRTQRRVGHRAGWDFTLSAPKSFSILWALADPHTRRKLQEIERRAVRKTAEYLQSVGGFTRTGRGGTEFQPSGLVIAAFSHSTSRARDPNRHYHLLCMNLGVRADGTTGTLDTRALFRHRHTADTVFQAELSYGLRTDIGLDTTLNRSWFEVGGVDKQLIDKFSTRRKEILQALRVGGALQAGTSVDARLREVANLRTRRTRELIPRAELFSTWKGVGDQLGFRFADLPRLSPEERLGSLLYSDAHCAALLEQAIAGATRDQSYFTERELTKAAHLKAIELGLGTDTVQDVIRKYLMPDAIHPERYHLRAVPLGVNSTTREHYYTTQSAWNLEQQMLRYVERSKRFQGPSVNSDQVAEVSARYNLANEQKEALSHIATQPGSIKIVMGLPGAGKTTMLKALPDLLPDYNIIGASLAARAARNLEDETGIRSTTIHRTLREIEKGDFHNNLTERDLRSATTTRQARFIGYQIDRRRFLLNERSLLIVDEASMVDTQQMARLVRYTQDSGAMLLLVGDPKQLQAIGWGGSYQAIASRLGAAELTHIRRQTGSEAGWQIVALDHFRGGRAREALAAYADRGHVVVTNTRRQAVDSLAQTWFREGGAENSRDHLAIAATRLETELLNRRLQAIRKNAGLLGPFYVTVDDMRLHQGDRIVFKRNRHSLGILNGDRGEITAIDPRLNIVDVRTDRGHTVSVTLTDYSYLTLGYASTTHSVQGATIDRNLYVLAGGRMTDLNLTYVQASRARHLTKFFIDKKEAGEELATISERMGHEREKALAVDVMRLRQKI